MGDTVRRGGHRM